MARKQKRRSPQRPRRPVGDAVAQPGVATARVDDDVTRPREDDAPDPIEHATPDVELAEAQLAMGRPQRAEQPTDAELTAEALGATAGGGRRSGRGAAVGGDEGGAHPAAAHGTAVAPRAGTRLVHFLQGSWRELHRVQWPDRRQVMQATGVVIGFVIVAGVFLGVADLVASKAVTAILK